MPYMGLAPRRPEDLFLEVDLERLFGKIHQLREAVRT